MEINELEAKIKRDRKIDLSRKMTASNILNELARATVKETSLINDEVYREKIQRLQIEVRIYFTLQYLRQSVLIRINITTYTVG
jgi:hypothetical protein